MRLYSVPVLVIILLLQHGALAGPGRIETSVSPASKIVEIRSFVLAAGQLRLDLARPFIIPASDSLTMDGVPLKRGEDYRINTLRGTLILVRPARGGEKLVVRFSRYPFSFSPVFASRFPEAKPSFPVTELSPVASGTMKKAVSDQYRLRLSGSKTVGFSVGSNKGLGIDQSLKVTMVGTIARDLEVKAFLTDDNLPIQPEGNTEELKHLDKVYVQVQSRHSRVQIGDYTTGIGWSRFSAFNRELRGATADVGVGKQHFSAGGGIAKGRFRTVSLFGREGVQGPYELLPARRFNSVIVLPGTETVYIDGRLLKRGSENDYTVDYTRGTVTFSERIAVTDDSEIVVDYQIGEDEYQRTTVTAGWTSQLFADAVQLRTFFFQESDDSDNPVRGGLSAVEVGVLRGAGDDPDSAMASGIEEVEAGRGSYVLVEADSLPPHFRFVETGGEYLLDFYEVGTGRGEYAVDGFSRRGEIIYAYTGPGAGDYVVGRPLPLPKSKRVFTAGATASKRHLFFDAEGNVSQYDQNILSDRDDGDNVGSALHLEGGIKEIPVAPGMLTVTGEFSTLEDRFASPDKPREPYFYRNWNLEGVPLVGRENIGGAKLQLQGRGNFNLEGSYRVLTRGDDLSARKSDIAASFGDLRARGLRVTAFDSRTGNDRDRRFARAEGVYSFWHLAPRLSLESERYRAFASVSPDTGRFYNQGTVTVAARGTGNFNGELSYSLRNTDNLGVRGDRWRRSRENDEIRFSGGYGAGSRMVDLFVTHRDSRDRIAGTTLRSDLARMRYRDSWVQGGISTDMGYRISSGEERKLQKAVVYVGENEGDYDEEGREVGQKRGDYMVLYLPGAQKDVVRTVEFTWRLSLGRGLRGLVGGGAGGGWFDRIGRNISCDNFFSLSERSRTDDLFELYTMKPSLLQRDDLTLYGVNKLRQEWSFLNNVKKYALRLTITREDEEDNRSTGVPTERFVREIALKAEAAPTTRVTVSWEAASRLKERSARSIAEQNYRVTSLAASQVASYQPRPSTKLSFEFGAEHRLDEDSSAEQASYVVSPSFTSSVFKKIHAAGFFRLTYTDTKSEAGKPLFFLEEGFREDWSLMSQYRFTKNVSFGANYTGRREKNYLGEVRTVHDFKMESRAYF